jgi:hypothetical protein
LVEFQFGVVAAVDIHYFVCLAYLVEQ